MSNCRIRKWKLILEDNEKKRKEVIKKFEQLMESENVTQELYEIMNNPGLKKKVQYNLLD